MSQNPSLVLTGTSCSDFLPLLLPLLLVEADEEIARLWHQEIVTGGSSYTEPSTWESMAPEAATLLEERLTSAVQDGTVERAGQFCAALLEEWLTLCAERLTARTASM